MGGREWEVEDGWKGKKLQQQEVEEEKEEGERRKGNEILRAGHPRTFLM